VDDIISKEANEEEATHNVSIDLEGSSSISRKNIRPSKSGEIEKMNDFLNERSSRVIEVVNEIDNIPNFNGAL